jgi:hypothetical protein
MQTATLQPFWDYSSEEETKVVWVTHFTPPAAVRLGLRS